MERLEGSCTEGACAQLVARMYTAVVVVLRDFRISHTELTDKLLQSHGRKLE